MAMYRRTLVMLAFAVLLVLRAPGSEAAVPAARQQAIAGLDVVVWLPDPATPGPWPMLVFSHGFHGCARQSTFLTAGLAAAGYAVFAPNHHDAACGDLARWRQGAAVPFGAPQRWDETSYADRRDDIRHLLDALPEDPRFKADPLDFQHVGLVGHSLGGYTLLGLGGAWASWKDRRVAAILALSPYSLPFSVQHSLGGLAGVPVMYQGGSLDIGITPFVARPGGAFDETPAPKDEVLFDGAGHFAWTDLNPTYQARILAYSRAFLDQALRGTPFPADLAAGGKGVTLRHVDR